MAPFRSLVAAALLFLSAANAHFELHKPVPLEGDSMDEKKEGNAPCGGGAPDLAQNKATDFHVDGDSVAVLLGHPQAKWLIRGTLDAKAAGGWTQLFPIVLQSGHGNFCEPVVAAPKDWAGKKGFISTVCDAPDGLLYQCAAVNFVSGASTAPGSSTCNNGTGVSVTFDSDATLTTLVGASNSTAATPSTSARPSASSSASSAASGSLLAPEVGLPIGSFVVTAFMLLLGAALL